MSKAEKLKEKLRNGNINAGELRTLMRQLGWELKRQKGSHEQWKSPSGSRLTLATHDKALKNYQIREAREKMI